MNTYTTRGEAIEGEIIEVLDTADGATAYDIEAIADEILDSSGEGPNYRWFCAVDADEFWTIAEKHSR